jgi:hypothetical protein
MFLRGGAYKVRVDITETKIKERVIAAIRQPVQVNAKTIRRLRKFSKETGLSITWIVNHAVNAWLDVQPQGALRMGGFAVEGNKS